jgi:hypothetical protein
MTATSIAPGQTYAGPRAYDPTTLQAPTPSGVKTAFDINLNPAATQNGLSKTIANPFFGFSIEMSVSNQVYGRNSTFLNVPFLNLMSNIAERAGEVHIRCGGNTQESAALVESNPSGRILEKDYSAVSGTTNTPPIDYTIDLLYVLGNISSLVNVKWFLGIPFNDTNFRMAIVQEGSKILGDNLLGLQAGNEPDFYGQFGRRPSTYSPFDYMGEVGDLINVMKDTQYEQVRNRLITPSVAQNWPLKEIWDTGIVDAYIEQIALLSVERYPNNNCGAVFNKGNAINPQDVIGQYLDHEAVRNMVSYYLESTLYAQTKNKPFIMFETNTASCGGFPGISNSFVAALWGLDYGLQLAYGNFSQALFHVGGQSVYYNPFTAPPTNESAFHEWTVGPIYYSVLVMAEAIGNTGSARVVDLYAADNSKTTPAYAIYEGDQPARVALFNYNSDPSGANDYTATVNLPVSVGSVKVKRLSSPTVTQINNFTWAGQTFGEANFASDGRPKGEVTVETVTCTPGDNGSSRCPVKVPAPGFALVFVSDKALQESDAGETHTYSTTAITKGHNTATVDPSVLATSNGHDEDVREFLGSTSQGSQNQASTMARIGVGMLGIVVGTMFVVLNKLR